MDAAIYLRVSSDEQARRGFSIAAQEEACTLRARETGATRVTRFADEGISGSVLERPGLRALRDEVKAGRVGVIVVYDPDRLARNLGHQLLVTEEFERSGVRLEFVNFDWQDTPEGRLFYALRGAISQYEKAKIRERTTLGRRQRARCGKLPSGFQPYGYRYDPATGTLQEDAREGQWVRRMFCWVLDGIGPNRVASSLNEMGVPRKRGGLKWHRSVVLRMLTNEAYAGTFYANRYDCEDVSIGRYLPRDERARVSLRPRGEWIPIAVPPLVSREVFDRVQEVLTRARRLWPGGVHERYLLSGLVVCGACGRPMSGRSSMEWGVRKKHYSCRSKGGCGLTAPACDVEREVWSLVRAAVGDPLSVVSSAPAGDELEGLRRRLRDTELEMKRIESARSGVALCMSQGLMDAAEGERRLAALGEESREASDCSRRVLGSIAALDGARADWMMCAARKWLCEMDQMDGELRRDLVRALVTRIVIAGPDEERGAVTVEVTGYLEGASLAECTQEGDPDVPAIDSQGQG